MQSGVTINDQIKQMIEPLKTHTEPSFSIRFASLKSAATEERLPDEKKKKAPPSPLIITKQMMTTVTKAIEASFERPIKIDLDFSNVLLDDAALFRLGLFIKGGKYPYGMTINLKDSALIDSRKEDLFVDQLTGSTGRGVHLIISNSFFSYSLSHNIYQIIENSSCLESLVIEVRGAPVVRLDHDLVVESLLVNTHLLNLQIPQAYYAVTFPHAPNYFSSFEPPFFDEGPAIEIDKILQRNQRFQKAKIDYFFSFMQCTPLIPVLSQIIFDYIAYDLVSEDEEKEMAETACNSLTSKGIRVNGFDTFNGIFQKYKPACKVALQKSVKFKSVLRQYLRPFLHDLQAWYNTNLLMWEILKPKNAPTTTTVVVKSDLNLLEDMQFFIQLSEITVSQLEREIVFLSSPVVPSDEWKMEDLKKTCIDQKEVCTLTLGHDHSFETILTSNPAIVYLDLKGSSFFKNAELFLNVLADPKCPENLTIIIYEAMNKPLLETLTDLVKSGKYPKGTCFILKATKMDPIDISPSLYAAYRSFFIALGNKQQAKNPELHLIVPLIVKYNSPVDSQIFLKEILLKLIVNNRYLKTLILTKGPHLWNPDFIQALRANDTITTFDIEVDAIVSIKYSSLALRNKELSKSADYLHMPRILASEFKSLEGSTLYGGGLDFAHLLLFAISRFDDNLSILFQPPFLRLFQANIIVLCKNILRLEGLSSDAIFKKIFSAGKITGRHLENDPALFWAYGHFTISASHYIADKIEAKTKGPSVHQKKSSFSVAPPIDDFVQITLNVYLPRDQKNHENLRALAKHDNEGFYEAIKTYFDRDQITLKEALGLLSIIDAKESQANPITIDQLTREIHSYDRHKGRFRKFFNHSTRTITDLRTLLSVVKSQRCDVNCFQMKLILAARDKRNTYIRRRFRSGIVRQSVAFFRTGNEIYTKKTCWNNTYSKTENVIDNLSKICYP